MTGQLAVQAVTGGFGRGPRGQLTTLWSGAARCSIPRCGKQIDPSRLMCRAHWYRVPKELRDRIWATWRSGEGAYSGEHRGAVHAAVVAVLATVGEIPR
jgi:heme A synthase